MVMMMMHGHDDVYLIQLLIFCYLGWTTESLLNWSQFIKLAVSGMAMICIEWWSFEVGAFLTGTVYTTLNIILLINACSL